MLHAKHNILVCVPSSGSFFIAVEYILQTFTGGFHFVSTFSANLVSSKEKKNSYIFRFIIFKTHQHYIINNTCFFVKLWNQKHTIIDLFSLKRICFILKINKLLTGLSISCFCKVSLTPKINSWEELEE